MMGAKGTLKQTAKFLDYVLGRHPDEFGLVTDENGWVKIKDLLKAVSEEDGWKHFRRSHINELLLTLPEATLEVNPPFIRSVNRSELPVRTIADDPPKILFVSIRKRAHAHVHKKGINPGEGNRVIFSTSVKMSERIGKRLDADPVMLTVNVQQAQAAGVVFYSAGDILYVSDFLPAGCFTGPPLPKEAPDLQKQVPREKPAVEKTPGSFTLEFNPDAGSEKKATRKTRKKEIAWKKERRQQRKHSRRR